MKKIIYGFLLCLPLSTGAFAAPVAEQLENAISDCCNYPEKLQVVRTLLKENSDSALNLKRTNVDVHAWWPVLMNPGPGTLLDLVRIHARYKCPNKSSSVCPDIARELSSRGVTAVIETHPTAPYWIKDTTGSMHVNPVVVPQQSYTPAKKTPCTSSQLKAKNASSGTVENGECRPDKCEEKFDLVQGECKPKCKEWERRIDGKCVKKDCTPEEKAAIFASSAMWRETQNICWAVECLDGQPPQMGKCNPVSNVQSIGPVVATNTPTVTANPEPVAQQPVATEPQTTNPEPVVATNTTPEPTVQTQSTVSTNASVSPVQQSSTVTSVPARTTPIVTVVPNNNIVIKKKTDVCSVGNEQCVAARVLPLDIDVVHTAAGGFSQCIDSTDLLNGFIFGTLKTPFSMQDLLTQCYGGIDVGADVSMCQRQCISFVVEYVREMVAKYQN